MKIYNYIKQKFCNRKVMSKILGSSLTLLTGSTVLAQNNEALIKSETYIGAYHIKCNGQSTGQLEAIPNFGTAPYTYEWSSGETTAIISNKPAGIYYVTITDAQNIMRSDTFEIIQPRPFTYELQLSDYDGFQISTTNNTDGIIEIIANGGTPPYTYQWSNGDSLSIRKELGAGTYNFTLTDANHCINSGSVTLSQPDPVVVSFTDVEGTSCHGSLDGKATITISGGRGNFSVVWNNGNFSFQPQNLAAGYNSVRIFEQGVAIIDTGITITEPSEMVSTFALSQYNGFNVSCADCFNGSITSSTTGGTAPYSYQWDDINNSTGSQLNNLNGGLYQVVITDAHGCQSKNSVRLSMPVAKDWSRNGNASIDSSAFIGTSDNSPLNFKINQQQVMQLTEDTISIHTQLRIANINQSNTFVDGTKVLGVDEQGNIRAFERGDIIAGPSDLIPDYSCNDCGCTKKLAWGIPSDIVNGVTIPGNTDDIVKCPIEGNVCIGGHAPEANSKLDLIGEIAISGERLHVGYDGNVGVGTLVPNEKLHLFGGNFKVTCPWDNSNPVFYVNHSNKNAGIGTGAPRGKFEIKMNTSDNISFGNMRTEASGWATSYIGLNAYRESGGIWKSTSDGANSGGSIIYSNSWGDLKFSNLNGQNSAIPISSDDAGIKENTSMTLTNDGRLAIGVDPRNHNDLLNYKLVVDGNIKCKKLKVEIQNWGDYVFDDSYELMDLNSIEKYITTNKHLPGMPSAAEIEAKGIDLGEMVKMQQVKIEELTLLLIQMQKQIENKRQ